MDAATSTAIDPEDTGDYSDLASDEDSESVEPVLPPPSNDVQKAQLLPLSRKRTREEVYSNSSDPPIFSSDDLPPGLENYSTHRQKRQLQGPWWWTPSGQHQKSSEGGVRQKREFKRNMDSGVWMNSDDTEADGRSDLVEETTTKAAENESHKGDEMDNGTNGQIPDDDHQALKDDAAHFQLSRMDLAQKFAMFHVLREVEEGHEVYDLA